MKIKVCIMILLLIITIGCLSSAKLLNNDESENFKENNEYNSNEIQNCLNKYYEFLRGEITSSTKNKDSSIIDIYDVFIVNENYNRYTFFDSNHNGVPELHLLSPRVYMIFECIGNELETIYSGSGYETLLNNGAILYTRYGGAPQHISYVYFELDSENNIFRTDFAKYTDNNDVYDEEDLYLYDNIEISKSEFDEKTMKYLNIGSDLIVWSDYWTFLAEKNNCNCSEETN